MDEVAETEVMTKPVESKEAEDPTVFRALSEDGGEIAFFLDQKNDGSSVDLYQLGQDLKTKTHTREGQVEQKKVPLILKEKPPEKTFLKLKIPGQTRLYLRTEEPIQSVKKEDDAVYLELVPINMPKQSEYTEYNVEPLDKYLTGETLQQMGTKPAELPRAA